MKYIINLVIAAFEDIDHDGSQERERERELDQNKTDHSLFKLRTLSTEKTRDMYQEINQQDKQQRRRGA